jgi:hypothetical protein
VLDGVQNKTLDRAGMARRSLAETMIGPYKTECVREGSPFRTGPLRILTDPEDVTSACV